MQKKKEVYGIIYLIECQDNKKKYIGQTTNTLKERIDTYKREFKFSKRLRPITKAMRKYGFENFSFSEIAKAYSREQLDNFKHLNSEWL